jgi:hypothetical protein
LNEVLSGQA